MMKNASRHSGSITAGMVMLAVYAGASANAASTQKQMREAYGRLPMRFEKNEGQTDRSVQYLARGSGYTLFLTRTEAVLALAQTNAKSTTLRMRLSGANVNPKLSPQDPLPGQVNYFRGNDRTKWHAGIATWNTVKYEKVYPGIDLVFYGNQGQLEFDFIARPGADPSNIRFRVDGARATVDRSGDVVLAASGETVKMQKPVVYQDTTAGRRPVAGRFVVTESNEIAFALGDYDHRQPLVIDPTLVYASYLGGTQENRITGLAVAANGEAFVTGFTYSADFPTTGGAIANLQPMCAPGDCSNVNGPDAFVARISADGTNLIYSTYLGGNNEDEGRAIAVDAAGNAYVTGYTYSNDFPLMNPFQSLCSPSGLFDLTANPPQYTRLIHGCEGHPPGEALAYSAGTPDVFITKLDPTGSQILYSTFFGGSGNDNPSSIALDSDGNIIIAGSTSSIYKPGDCCFPSSGFAAFPVTTSAYQDGLSGTQDQNYFVAFLAKFTPDGQTLLYSTTFGGPGGSVLAEVGNSMAVGQNGFVAIGGNVTSAAMPTRNAIQTGCVAIPSATATCSDSAFLAAFDTTQSGDASLIFATYLGGSVPSGAGTHLYGVAVDGTNNVYATGNTQAHDFPATPGTLFPGCSTTDATRFCNDSFVLKTGPAGDLAWATYFGDGVGPCPPLTSYAITTDVRSNVYFTGNLGGCGLAAETSVNPIQSVTGTNAFVAALSADGSTMLLGTPFGGNSNDQPAAIALDANANIVIAGYTDSTTLPGTAGAFQPSNAGGAHNGFIASISSLYLGSSTSLSADPNPAASGQSVTLTATVTGQSGQAVPTGSVAFFNCGVSIGMAALDPSGFAVFTTNSLPSGTFQLTASYGGDSVYLGGSSPAVPLTVTPASDPNSRVGAMVAPRQERR
jgi:hypothetical protein